MELGLLDKMKILFQLLFSSFMSIEIVIFFLLLFLLLVVNIKVKNKIMSILLTVLFVVSIIVFVYCFSSYALTSIDFIIMKIMDYYYFPSTMIYFFLFLLMVGVCIFTIFSKKLGLLKKVFNYFSCTSFFLLFSMFVMFIVDRGFDMADTVTLYQNRQILSVVQVSNLIVLFWLVVSLFYHLYSFFKKKFDDKKEKVETI